MKTKIEFNDEVSSSSGKDVKDTRMLSAEAREKFATGTNTTKRYTKGHGALGKLGAKGHPS